MIDLKSDPIPTYTRLKQILAPYDPLLTHFTNSETHEGPITIILTGNNPRDLIAREPNRIVACDGTLADLNTNPPPTFIPLISSKWQDTFTWNGNGPIPANERAIMRELASRSHAQHRKLRFWAAPDNPAAWKELHDADVDLINTDHLKECRAFLLHPRP